MRLGVGEDVAERRAHRTTVEEAEGGEPAIERARAGGQALSRLGSFMKWFFAIVKELHRRLKPLAGNKERIFTTTLVVRGTEGYINVHSGYSKFFGFVSQ